MIVVDTNAFSAVFQDETAMPFIKDRSFYETASPPKLYTGSRNRDLLNPMNIVRLRNVV